MFTESTLCQVLNQGTRQMKKRLQKSEAPVEIPDDLDEALDSHLPSRDAFDRLPASHQREYIAWIEDAKRPATRQNRIEKTLAKLLERQ